MKSCFGIPTTQIQVILVATTALTSCHANFEDVSEQAPYSELIGDRYKLTEDLLIHGITEDLRDQHTIDFYLVTEKPGISGPEVLSRDVLDAGTLIEIESVTVCTNCFESGIHLEVKVSDAEYDHHRVMIYSEYSANGATVELLSAPLSTVPD